MLASWKACVRKSTTQAGFALSTDLNLMLGVVLGGRFVRQCYSAVTGA